MDAEVFLTYSSLSEEDVRDRTVVVIDVLRACSTVVTALDRGARAVLPVADMAEAGKIASNLDPDVYRLGGERGGEKIDGYHLGNSPLEYTREVVEGRDVILNTTNGTQALTRARGAEHLVAACFLNAQRVVDFVRAVDDQVTIVCAGRQNRLALEDALCAGLLLARLWNHEEPDVVTDSAHTVFTLYETDRDNLDAALRGANHAEHLSGNGYEEDLDYCFRTDVLPVLPYYTDNRLLSYDASPLST
jgi:2-phosphosulfolactate phosphatase